MSRRLFVNIGNTAVHWALEQDGHWLADGRVGLGEASGAPARLFMAVGEAPDAVIACVSNPQVLAVFAEASPAPIQVLGRDFTGGIAVGYRDPGQLGADRLASATGAARLFGVPCVVVSAGTCLTCEALSAEVALIGGAIAPGLPAYLQGLTAATPHLPALALDPSTILPEPGTTTQENLGVGVCLSLAGAADRLAVAMRQSVGESAALILTGGDAGIVERFSLLQWQAAPLLDLEGLRIIHDGV